ncbi:MAG: GntR family transcriptional regulator [Verrucomicrobiota bacterium]
MVKGISEAEIKEIYLIRQGLEGVCCRRTAELISGNKLQQLEAAMDKAKKLVEEGQRDEASESADELHRVILSMGSEGRIESIVKSITEITYWLHQIALATPGRLEKSIQEHAHVVEALKARDADEAERRIRAHIRSTEADVLAVYINHK